MYAQDPVGVPASRVYGSSLTNDFRLGISALIDSPDRAGCRASPARVRPGACRRGRADAYPKAPQLTSFQDFALAESITRALREEKYVTPTPIQTQAIPVILSGRDVIGIAQTGTGKTAAFALPILHHLAANPRRVERKTCRVLVLSPTRELSGQILDSFRTYGRHLSLTSALVIGGVSMGAQVRALLGGVDILVATPGRLLDLVQSNALRLNGVEFFVLDEADRMLDMGFIHDIRKIVSKLPARRHTMLFSATMPGAIAELAGQMLRDPARVAVTPAASTVERVEQRIIYVDRAAKPGVLVDVLRRETIDRALIFTRTKHGADKVVRGLTKAGITAAAIHGNKSQGQRERVLAAFRQGQVRTLVATDIAARGIDVDGISHVVNFDIPNIPETYVHRIGRTARAGADGIAISLCDGEERAFLRDIEKLIRMTIPATRADGGRQQPAAAGHAPRVAAHAPKSAHAPKKARPPQGRGNATAHGRNDHRQTGQNTAQARAGQSRTGQSRTGNTATGPAPTGIAAVAFLNRGARPGHGAAPRAPRWGGHPKGS
jgi:ATP-dependent RNA helicase RhlE